MLEHLIAFMIGVTWVLVIVALAKYIFSGKVDASNTNTQATNKTLLKPIFKPNKGTKETKEQKEYKRLMDNIDNYDGTGKNQQKVR